VDIEEVLDMTLLYQYTDLLILGLALTQLELELTYDIFYIGS